MRVEGARRLRATLKAAGVSVQDLKDAHKEVADLVARAAAPAAPRASGALADSVRTAGTASAAIVRAGGARLPYAGPIHWGWPARNIRAQPWLADAAAETDTAWQGVYLQAVEAIIATVEGA